MTDEQKIVDLLLESDQVDDVLNTMRNGQSMPLLDGRRLMTLIVYLHPEDQGEVLGIHVEEKLGIEDKFGG
jgi:hypothetical protein